MFGSPIEEIKSRLDIVDIIKDYVKLEKAGANYRGLCPFHSEKTPSFFVSPARQIWHCFGACGEGGDIFKFIMKIEGVEFSEALRILAKRAGIELKKENPKLRTERERLYEISELAGQFFEAQMRESSAGKKAKNYLLKRGVSEESIKKWRLGYAPDTWQGLSDFLVGRGYKREEIEKAGLSLKSSKSGKYYDRFRGRIMFPIFNLSSQIIGFGGRILEKGEEEKKEAKYINSPATVLYDKSQVLYGLNKASQAIRKNDACLLVEGYMDVIMTSQAGLENVVATSGTALTIPQLKILKRYSNNLLTAFDMDIAGDSATKRGISLAQSLGFNIKVVEMPTGSDPADVAKESPEKIKDLVEKAISIHDFYFKSALSQFDKNTLEGKKKISEVLLPIIKKIPNKIEQSVWVKDLAEVLSVSEESVLEELKKIPENDYPFVSEKVEIKNNKSDDEEGKKEQKTKEKTRKELLEEELVVFAIKSPESARLLEERDLNFISRAISEILREIKEKGSDFLNYLARNNNDVKNKKSGDEIIFKERDNKKNNDYDGSESLLDYFALKAEVEEIKGKEAGREFVKCLEELRKLSLKEELDKINRAIKSAEKEGDLQKAEELVKKFNEKSKLLK